MKKLLYILMLGAITQANIVYSYTSASTDAVDSPMEEEVEASIKNINEPSADTCIVPKGAKVSISPKAK